jgi:hypothetical protein
MTSPLDDSEQTLELPGGRWYGRITFSLRPDHVRIMAAFLASLHGTAGRFYLWDVSHPSPAGTAQGTPLVKGAGQDGRSLITDGWSANQTTLLKIGDLFGVNGELKRVTAPVASDANGEATISFESPLRSKPADNAPLTLLKPSCTMRLTSGDQGKQLIIRPPASTLFTLECVETFT